MGSQAKQEGLTKLSEAKLSKQIIFIFIFLVGILAVSSSQNAFAAVDMFIKIKDIPGESTDKSHSKEIDILSLLWSNAVQQTRAGSGAGKASPGDLLSVTKYIDKSTPKLFEALATGKHIDEATLVVRKAGSTPVEYLKYTLQDVMVTSYSTSGSGDRPTESISFNYGKIEVQYTELNADGTPGKVTVRGWDYTKNQAYCPSTGGTCGDIPDAAFSPIEKDTIPKLEEKPKPVEPATEIKTETKELRKLTIQKDKQASIPLSGEIEYKQGVPLEITLEKPDGTTESFSVIPESGGTYDTEIPIPEDLSAGLYKVKVKYEDKEVEEFSISILKEMVPSWIKNNAKWWSEKQIGDSDFLSGIQYMIQQKIILVTGAPSESAKDDVPVPEWVRNNAGWWAADQISEEEFVRALEFLIKNGIIKVS